MTGDPEFPAPYRSFGFEVDYERGCCREDCCARPEFANVLEFKERWKATLGGI